MSQRFLMDFHPRPQPQKAGAGTGSGGGAWGATMRAAGGKPFNDIKSQYIRLRGLSRSKQDSQTHTSLREVLRVRSRMTL